MSNGTEITLIGNLVDEVELRFTPGGAAVAKFRVASTPRKFNRDTNTWEDDKDGSLFLTCSVWRQAAENCAETLQKGMRVIVQGRLKQRSYDDNQGVRRTVYEVDCEEVGPSLRSATAKVTKASGGSRGGQGGGQGQGQGGGGWSSGGRQQGGGQSEDPWASSAPAGGQQDGSWDSPPF
ncbi:single-stranded DNA-binding protein (plasmid) [Streptomyces seoulensis]|uniref:Single-stranded DNA-binding protein n=1 Tax=Streptomyces seoulensis TaxID=73044 RepID=A0A4P6U822_STRSO|nr:single-stranded DNA-binding protein [Streptomyces seoulensis]QBJ94478.1 single-stranded DNA-binding protein [Streptomyces seoulensis]